MTTSKNLVKIGNGAFFWCTGLRNISIPNTVTSIGSYAFYGCTGLTSVSISGSVTSIGGYVFNKCKNLRTFKSHIEDLNQCIFGKWVFYGAPTSICDLIVPIGTRESYQSLEPWCDFRIIVEFGDVNNDNAVDVTDVVGIANHVMGETPSVFNNVSADFNDNGSVDVSDVVKLANIILGE